MREFLQSELKALPQLHSELAEAIQAFREWQRSANEQAPTKEPLSWLCSCVREEKAREDIGEQPGKKFRTLRNLWPQLERLLQEKSGPALDRMRPNELATELLARSFSAATYRVKLALDGQLQPLDAKSLRKLVTMQPLEPPKGKPGRPRGETVDTKQRIALAAAFEVLGWTKYAMAPYLFHEVHVRSAAYENTRRFFRRYKSSIKTRKANMSKQQAMVMLARAGVPQPPVE